MWGENHQPRLSEQECAAIKDAVLSTVKETKLGRALLQALDRAKVDIVFVNEVRAEQVTGGTAQKTQGADTRCFGLYDARNNTIYVDARAPLHAQLHFFAHEARHALQMAETRRMYQENLGGINDLSPVTHLYVMRLREMDADVFAVHFLARHDRETGSNHFAKMSERGGFLLRNDPYSRAALYEAFFDRWNQIGRPDDLGQAGSAAAVAFIDNTAILNTYNNFALHVWEKAVLQRMIDEAARPDSEYHQSVRAVARKENPESPREIFNRHAAAYAHILVKDGGPDYLAHVTAEQVLEHVCNRNQAASPWATTGHAYERAIEHFERAVKFYAKDSAPEENKVPPAAAKTATGKAPARGRK